MIISNEPARCKLTINDFIKQVISFNLLGIKLASGRNLYARKNKCKQQTLIKSIFTYPIQTRSETQKTKRTMRKTEIKTLELYRTFTPPDRLRSKEIEGLNAGYCAIVRVQKQNWNEHVELIVHLFSDFY